MDFRHFKVIFFVDRDSERIAKGKLMEFLSSAITPTDHQQPNHHQPNHSHIAALDATGQLVLPNMNELSVNSAVAVSLSGTVNSNITNQVTAFPNGIESPDVRSAAALNTPGSQISGKELR